MDHFVERDGEVHCEQVPLRAIAEQVGTPVYVYSTAAMLEQAALMKAAVPDVRDPLIAYAVKANANPAVLRTLARAGLGADVVSIGEYRRARAAGVALDKIVFSGVGKTVLEMAEALNGGLLQFNLESLEEGRTLSEVADALGIEAPVGFRVNPDVDAGTHAKITTGTSESKFGVPAADVLSAYEEASRLPGLRIEGLTIHIGSQLTSLEPLETAFARLGEILGQLRSAGHRISIVDLGGGLGIPYDGDQPRPPSPQEYGEMVRRVTGGWDARLVFEPGRLIVAEAGVLLSRVVRVKPGAKCPWVIVDAAMNDLLRPALYDAFHAIHAVVPKGRRTRANVVGPVCESGDTFALAREMDIVGDGDLLMFRCAGAYGAAMSSGYNSRPLAPEVLVNGREWALVRRRVDVDALASCMIPDWLAAP